MPRYAALLQNHGSGTLKSSASARGVPSTKKGKQDVIRALAPVLEDERFIRSGRLPCCWRRAARRSWRPSSAAFPREP
jgi:hypothetical protein